MVTLAAFPLLTPLEQLGAVYSQGEYLARRFEEDDEIRLYYLAGGFFAEVYFDQFRRQILRVRCFSQASDLDDYTPYIILPSL
jgi:hypothetical protein